MKQVFVRVCLFLTLCICSFALEPSMVWGAQNSQKSSIAQEPRERVDISFPTASTTGALYPLGAGIANLWNTKLDYVRVRAQASNGGIQNLNLLKSGDAQVSFAISSNGYEALHGERSFTKRPYKDLRVITGLYYNPNQLVVRKGLGIRSLQDLRGKRVAPGSAGSSTEVETRLHLTEAGLTYPDDIKAQFVGFTESIDLMRNKQLDAAWIMGGTPTAAVTEMSATADAKLLSIDPALIKQLQAKYPWYTQVIIPAGTYDNQDTDVLTSAIKMVLFTDASMPDDVIYDLTKTFWESLPELHSLHNAMKGLKKEMATSDLAGLPLHPGAERYYREAGML